MPKGAEPELMEKWKVQDALEMYGVRNWGKGYFNINKAGHLQVHPSKRPDRFVDLKELVDQLQARGIQLPILLRFTDILRHRVGELNEAFLNAMKEYDYKGRYICVYPIKVNQQRQVVEEILDFGKPFNFGLEAGSKPELLAVLALTNGGAAAARPKGTEENGTPIICNGFKDDEFIHMTMLARKIVKQIIPVVEKLT
jgi:arginine decarboxylase